MNKKENSKNLVKKMLLSISIMSFFVSACVENASAMNNVNPVNNIRNSIFGQISGDKSKQEPIKEDIALVNSRKIETGNAPSIQHEIIEKEKDDSLILKKLNKDFDANNDEKFLNFLQKQPICDLYERVLHLTKMHSNFDIETIIYTFAYEVVKFDQQYTENAITIVMNLNDISNTNKLLALYGLYMRCYMFKPAADVIFTHVKKICRIINSDQDCDDNKIAQIIFDAAVTKKDMTIALAMCERLRAIDPQYNEEYVLKLFDR